MFLISLVLGLFTNVFAQNGLLRLLDNVNSNSNSLSSCGQASAVSANGDLRDCIQEICEQASGLLPPDSTLVAQIRNTPDPRNTNLKNETNAAFNRAIAAATRSRDLVQQSNPRALVRQTLAQGPESVSELLRLVAGTSFISYPKLHGNGGVAFSYPPEIRENPQAIRAAQNLARNLRSQLNQDFFAQYARPGYVPNLALDQMRSYYPTYLRSLPNGPEKVAVQTIIQRLNATTNSPQLFNEIMGNIAQAKVNYPQVQLSCSNCENDLVTLMTALDVTRKYSPSELTKKRNEFPQTIEMSCRTAAWGLRNMAPTVDEKTAFSSTANSVLNRYVQNIYSRFSRQTQQGLSTINYELDSSLEVEGEILPKAEEIQETFTAIPNSGGALEVYRQVRQLHKFGETVACKTDYAIAGDNFNPATGVLHLSPWVIKHGDGAILAHELGHLLSDFFTTSQASPNSASKFRQTRACITQASGGAVEGGMHPGDGLRTEEDTADFFAQIAVGGIQQSMCRLLFDPVSALIGINETQQIVVDPEDPHSPLLWRALNGLVTSGGQLPRSCQFALSQANITPPRDCRSTF